ncbi:MAG: zinc-binding dehydrogenase [Clostridia bacterium]|nr:zinc-binding dehydrogenase [Clostridia bacterium]
MKTWKLTTPNTLERQTTDDLKISAGLSKVKITKALVCDSDAAIFCGSTRVKYPIVPGRFAIGQITETGEDSFLNRGERVYLSPSFENELSELGFEFAGKDVDGFYRDFALTTNDDAYTLPSSVSDEAAFLIDPVAFAEKIVDELNLSIGQHVLVFGGGLYGNILCQILIYHRFVPILADNNAARLEIAKKSGIYYTFPNDENLHENVLRVTGGKLAEGAVYLAFNNPSEPSAIFAHVANGARVAFCSRDEKTLNVNLQNAMRRNVTITGVTECREYISTAINILANKVINFSQFSFRYSPEEKLPALLKEYAEKAGKTALADEHIDVVKFIF